MADMYDRQKDINIHLPESVAVVGCGGVGVWAALYTTMIGVKRICLFDSDIIEEHNLNRIPFKKEDLMKSKVSVLGCYLREIRPDTLIIENPAIHDFSLLFSYEVVLDCTDDLKVQKEMSAFCKEHNIRYIKSGYDKTHITLTSSIPGWNAEPENTVGYDTPPTPSFVLPASLLGSLMVMAMVYDKVPDISMDTRDFFEGEKHV